MQLTLHAPQLIFIVLSILSLVGACILHGKEYKRNCVTTIIDMVCLFALLYWGGFFG